MSDEQARQSHESERNEMITRMVAGAESAVNARDLVQLEAFLQLLGSEIGDVATSRMLPIVEGALQEVRQQPVQQVIEQTAQRAVEERLITDEQKAKVTSPEEIGSQAARNEASQRSPAADAALANEPEETSRHLDTQVSRRATSSQRTL